MKYSLFLGVILFVIILLVAPTAFAAGVIPNSLVPCDGPNCDACALTSLGQNVINIFVYLAGAFATIMFAYAGILYVTSASNPGQIEKAHKIFWNVLIGMVFVLGSWLIIDTVMKALYNTGSGFGPWNEILIKNCKGGGASISQTALQDGTVTDGGIPRGQTPTPEAPTTPTIAGPFEINTFGPDGKPLPDPLGFAPTKSDQVLQQTYNQAAKYNDQITTACNTYGQALGDRCVTAATEAMARESSGINTGCNEKGSCGLMGVKSENKISQSELPDCTDILNTTCNISSGIKYLNTQYTKFGNNLPNAFAAYNSGGTTKPGQGTDGSNTAMVTSKEVGKGGCGSSYYAWQCSKEPGGLIETQNYVANACRTLILKGVSC